MGEAPLGHEQVSPETRSRSRPPAAAARDREGTEVGKSLRK